MSKKKKKSKAANRIAPIIIGVIIVLCSMIPVSSSLFGQTGYITEITRTERIGGREDINGQPNAYKWTVAYNFKMKNGEIETGSTTVHGDAVSSKSGLRVGSPIRYLAVYPGFNTPGDGGLDGSTVVWVLMIGFGIFMIWLGARKPKPSKTPAQRSREYKAAKAAKESPATIAQTKPTGRENAAMPANHSGGRIMFCENCGAQINNTAKFCRTCGACVAARASQQALTHIPLQPPEIEPDWDSFEYDNDMPITEAEADELYRIATEEEIEDEFDLINSTDEGPAYCRKILAIIRWRRANGQ